MSRASGRLSGNGLVDAERFCFDIKPTANHHANALHERQRRQAAEVFLRRFFAPACVGVSSGISHFRPRGLPITRLIELGELASFVHDQSGGDAGLFHQRQPRRRAFSSRPAWAVIELCKFNFRARHQTGRLHWPLPQRWSALNAPPSQRKSIGSRPGAARRNWAMRLI